MTESDAPVTTEATVPITTRALDLIAAEWIKIRSVRSTYLALAGGTAAAIAIGVFSAATVKASQVDYATFDAVDTSLSGLVVLQLAFGVFGALAIASEHSTGTIRTTFAAAPRRRAVLAAKAAVTAAVSMLAGELIAFAAFFAGQAALPGNHLSVTLGDPGVLRAVLGAGFYLFIVTLVGLALGAIIRNTAGAIAAVGLIFVQALLVNLVFPDPKTAWVARPPARR